MNPASWFEIFAPKMSLVKTNGTWPPPTEINDEHKVYSIAISIVVLCAITTIIVLWRLWARYKTESFGLDDYAIIPALVRIATIQPSVVGPDRPVLTHVFKRTGSSSTLAGQSWPSTSTSMPAWGSHCEKLQSGSSRSGSRASSGPCGCTLS